MEPPNSSTEDEQAHTLEDAFHISVRTQEDRAMAHEPGKSTGDMEEDANVSAMPAENRKP